MNKELFQKVRDLNLPSGKYVLFGSTPMGVRGLKECGDIDIIVTKDIWDEYKDKPKWKFKKMTHGSMSGYLEDNRIQIWKDWYPGGWNIEKLITEAEMIENLPFVGLEQVVKWKKLNGRDKDLKDIKAIEKFLNII